MEYIVTLYRNGSLYKRNRFKNPDDSENCLDRLERKYGHDEDYYIDYTEQ